MIVLIIAQISIAKYLEVSMLQMSFYIFGRKAGTHARPCNKALLNYKPVRFLQGHVP